MTPTWARCLPVALEVPVVLAALEAPEVLAVLAVPVVLAVPEVLAALAVPVALVALPVCLQCRTWAPRMMRWKSISPAAP